MHGGVLAGHCGVYIMNGTCHRGVCNAPFPGHANHTNMAAGRSGGGETLGRRQWAHSRGDLWPPHGISAMRSAPCTCMRRVPRCGKTSKGHNRLLVAVPTHVREERQSSLCVALCVRLPYDATGPLQALVALNDMIKDVWILVLGDVGRSPRMQYHALSVLRESHRTVRFFGYLQSPDGLRPELIEARQAGRLVLVNVWRMCAPRQGLCGHCLHEPSTTLTAVVTI